MISTRPERYELLFSKVTEDDAGDYKVVAENDYGSASTVGTVKVTNTKFVFIGLDADDE